MAKSERQRQAKLARKKHKKSVRTRGAARPQRRVLNPTVLSDARTLPIRDVRVNADWRETGEATLVFAREVKQIRAVLTLGVYEVDLWGRGVTDAWAEVDVPVADYEKGRLPRIFGDAETASLPPEVATALVYRAVEHAATLGLAPAPDFAVARLVLPAPDKAASDADIPLGRDGRPVIRLAAGEDGVKLLAAAEARIGAGGFDVEREEQGEEAAG